MFSPSRATRLVLLCAGATRSTREGGFPDPTEPLDDGGRDKARGLRLDGPAPAACLVGPTRAARETADLLGMAGSVEPALADMAAGDWAGRSLDAIEREALLAWLAAPEAGAPGGETMGAVVARVGPWLDALRGRDGPVLAITHAAVIRAALVHALGLPFGAALAIDVAPLGRVRLSFHGRWRLQELRRA